MTIGIYLSPYKLYSQCETLKFLSFGLIQILDLYHLILLVQLFTYYVNKYFLAFHCNYYFVLEVRLRHKTVKALQLLTLLKISFTVLQKNIIFINHQLGKLMYDFIRFIILLPNYNVSQFYQRNKLSPNKGCCCRPFSK